MKESIIKFFGEDKSVLWAKTHDFEEIESSVREGIEQYENKKFYIYEDGKTRDASTDEEVIGLDNAYKVIDEFFPKGMKKNKTVLLLKAVKEEILESKTLNYLIEILKAKSQNNSYNFIVIISTEKYLPKMLDEGEEYEEYLDFIDKEEEEVELSLQKYIYLLAKENKVVLTEEKAAHIMDSLNWRIKNEINLKGKDIVKEKI